jgi:hypothetical protein
MDLNAPSGGEYAYTVQAEDFHGNMSPLVKLTNPTSRSFSVMQQDDSTCPLGPVYDEANFSPVDGSGPTVPPLMCMLPGEFDQPQSPPNSDIPKLPVCTIEAHYRNLATQGGFLAGHGYLTFYRSDTHQTLIIEGYAGNNHQLMAWNSPVGIQYDNPSVDKIVGTVPTSTNACTYDPTILGPAVTKINNANILYQLNGPNSNSVWRYLISLLPGFKGGGITVFPPATAIGYNATLPGVE